MKNPCRDSLCETAMMILDNEEIKNPCNKECVIHFMCSKPCEEKSNYLLYLTSEIAVYDNKNKYRDQRYQELLQLKVKNRVEIMEIFSRKGKRA